MSQYNPRTIRRDLALLTEERLYTVEIKVRAGGARVSMVDIADFIPPIEVLDVWNSLSTKTKPPQIRLFESLEIAVKTLAEYRRSLYENSHDSTRSRSGHRREPIPRIPHRLRNC